MSVEESVPVQKLKRGFASMTREQNRAISSLGGKTAHSQGKGHTFTPEEARAAGRKGGLRVSQNREHMRAIGALGGQVIGRNREHMREISEKGRVSRSERAGRG